MTPLILNISSTDSAIKMNVQDTMGNMILDLLFDLLMEIQTYNR